MNTEIIKMIAVGVFFFLTMLSGIGLTKAGKPYNTFRVTVHRLVSFALLTMATIQVVYLHQSGLLSIFLLVLFIVVGILFIVEIISGVLLAAGKEMKVLNLLHKAMPIVITLGIGLLYFLTYRK